MTTEKTKQSSKTRERATREPNDARAAREAYTLAQMIYGRLATTQAWNLPGGGMRNAAPFTPPIFDGTPKWRGAGNPVPPM